MAEYLKVLEGEEAEEASSIQEVNIYQREEVNINQEEEVMMADQQAAVSRRKLHRLHQRVLEYKEQLADQRADESGVSSEYENLQEVQEQLDYSTKSIFKSATHLQKQKKIQI